MVYNGNIEREQSKTEEKKMYEVVKVVKGYEITRMKGTRGFYHVCVSEGEYFNFHTIKAAAAFIELTL